MFDYLTPGAGILFDDYEADVATAQVLSPWYAQYGVTVEDVWVQENGGRFALLRLP
jgi:hypothetical protein